MLMIAGGLLGLLCWIFIPRQYTAVVRLSVGIDYNRTGKLEEIQEDRLLGITEDILHSDSVMEQVFAQSGFTDYRNFFDHTLITRTNETWSLLITDRDPEKIGRLALIWLDQAYDSLQNARKHAIKAEALQNELEGLTRCVQEQAASVLPSGCPESPEEISADIDYYANAIEEELTASHGLPTAIQLASKNPDQLEIKPASRSAAVVCLCGAFIGLLIAFAIVWIPKNETNA